MREVIVERRIMMTVWIGVAALIAACGSDEKRDDRVINLVTRPPSGVVAHQASRIPSRPAEVAPAPVSPVDVVKDPQEARGGARISLLKIKGAGKLSRAAVQKKLEKIAASCPCAASQDGAATVELVIKIKPGGGLGYVKVRQNSASPKQTRCLLDWARRWRLGKPRGGASYLSVSVRL